MRAAVVERPGVLCIKEMDIPKPSDDEVLIRVDSASICNATDFHGVFDGYHDFYPQIMGHEVAGEVVETGKNVTELKKGDLVAEYTPRGAFCEYTVVNPKTDLWVRIPKSIPLRARSLVEMFHGAYVLTVYPAQITKDETVLVVGQGPMGLTAAAGAGLTADEIAEKIREKTGGLGADVVIMAISEDRSEYSDAYDMAISAMRQGGRMTGLFVDAKEIGKNQRINPRQLLRKEARFCHTLNPIYHSLEDELKAFQHAVDAVADGKIDLECMITHEIGLSELERALDLCHNRLDEVLKVAVYPDR